MVRYTQTHRVTIPTSLKSVALYCTAISDVSIHCPCWYPINSAASQNLIYTLSFSSTIFFIKFTKSLECCAMQAMLPFSSPDVYTWSGSVFRHFWGLCCFFICLFAAKTYRNNHFCRFKQTITTTNHWVLDLLLFAANNELVACL